MSARADATIYHDAPGLAATALTADMQTSGTAGDYTPKTCHY